MKALTFLIACLLNVVVAVVLFACWIVCRIADGLAWLRRRNDGPAARAARRHAYEMELDPK